MARMRVKATYALDVETVQTLEKMAQRWAVSKSEAVRRAIRAAANIDRLDQLQRALALSPSRVKTWIQAVRAERPVGATRGSGKAR